MSDAVERLRIELDTIARSEYPSMTFTTEDPTDGEWSSATTWFAPTEDLDLLSLSAPAPARVHSTNIEACEDLQIIARVSGGMREDGQPRNDANCHGVTFSGEARALQNPEEVAHAIGILTAYGTFDRANLEKYFGGGTELVPTHRVYLFRTKRYTVMDGRLGSDNPDRIARLVRSDWTSN